MKSKVLDKILGKINKIVNGVNLKPYAKETAERITRRTRTGQGLKETERGSKRESLKNQRDLTIEYKKARKKSPRLNRKLTSPSKNNLTHTGQMLDSIRGTAQGKNIVIDMKENRDDGKTNKDIMNYQQDQGRHFFELSNKEVKDLRDQLKKDLIKNIKKRKL